MICIFHFIYLVLTSDTEMLKLMASSSHLKTKRSRRPLGGVFSDEALAFITTTGRTGGGPAAYCDSSLHQYSFLYQNAINIYANHVINMQFLGLICSFVSHNNGKTVLRDSMFNLRFFYFLIIWIIKLSSPLF